MNSKSSIAWCCSLPGTIRLKNSGVGPKIDDKRAICNDGFPPLTLTEPSNIHLQPIHPSSSSILRRPWP